MKTEKFIYEVNGMKVEFDREPTEADIDEAARQLSGAKSTQPKQDSSMINEASFLDNVGKKTMEVLRENQEEALGLAALGAGSYLASKIPGVRPAFGLAAEAIKGAAVSGKNIASGLGQGMFGGPNINPIKVGTNIAQAGGSPLQQTLGRGAARVGQFAAEQTAGRLSSMGARVGQFAAEQTAGRLAPMAARALPMLAGATGTAALPVLAGTAAVLGPAYAGYKMYQNYAKMTPLERQQRLEEAQQAGLPGP
jgi:hypothetical protein